MTSIVIAINIHFFSATEWFLTVLNVSLTANMFCLSSMRGAWFHFYNHYFIRCRQCVHGHPICSIRLPIYGKWICLLRALMCKPLNNHKNKIIARKIWNCEWNEKNYYLHYICLVWFSRSNNEQNRTNTSPDEFPYGTFSTLWIKRTYFCISPRFSSKLNFIRDLWLAGWSEWMAYQIYGCHKRLRLVSHISLLLLLLFSSRTNHMNRRQNNRAKWHTAYRNYVLFVVRGDNVRARFIIRCTKSHFISSNSVCAFSFI